MTTAGLVVAWCGFLAANPCTNGSFEEVTADGRPVDWEILNQGAIIAGDAHTGVRALRLVRAANDPLPETGLNRRWRPKSGERGAMVDRLEGGMEFWYKALTSSNSNLFFFAIPMDATAFETAGKRAQFTVPEDHVGDGQWHRGRVKYDYSDNDKVKWVHFAVRILGGGGEMLVDDIAYVDEVGPWLAIDHVRLEESTDAPGDHCTLHATVMNKGDTSAEATHVVLEAQGLRAEPPETALPSLPPEGKHKLSWEVHGRRAAPGEVRIWVRSGEMEASACKAYAPELAIQSFGPVSPVVRLGKQAMIECVLRNDGNAVVLAPSATFHFPDADEPVSGSDIPPGAGATLRTAYHPKEEAQALPVDVAVRAANMDTALHAESRIRVIDAIQAPEPGGVLHAEAGGGYALLENGHVRLMLWQGGAGPGELAVKTAAGWHTVAWLPLLSTLVYRDGAGARLETALPGPEDDAPDVQAAADSDSARLRIRFRHGAADKARWDGDISFALARGQTCIETTYALRCSCAQELLRFDGPMLYVLDRDEALFPGVEWLLDDELSSSTLEIEEGHPHQVRYVPHPNMVTIPAIGIHGKHGTVGLLWDVHQQWDGARDRPAAVFASPDRFNNQRAHLMGLQLPTVPEFLDANTREAERPYPLKAGQTLRLECGLYADGAARDALAAVDAWLRIQGFPDPSSLPHGSYEDEIGFSMRGYLDSLWDAETKQWWSTKNGHPLMAYLTRPPAFVADLLLGASLSADETVRAQCRGRAEEMAAVMGYPARRDALRFHLRDDFGRMHADYAATSLMGRSGDGLWHFDADHEDDGVFKGMDYHFLGPDEADALGTSAGNARMIMRYVRVSGDWEAYRALEPTLDRMMAYRVPRAAQVWEVPFHAPDILAAAYAVDAYVDAYRFTGEPRWREAAVTWARRGLPFIYLWDDPEKPYLLGASIPVYGATLFRHSWFGRPVQWNGLCYANALLYLSEIDGSYPWRRIAATVIHSAIHQQAPDGEDAALWPDSISAIDGEKSAWVFAPRQILEGITKLMGRDEEPSTTMLGEGRKRIHVTAVGKVSNAVWADDTVSFAVTYPAREQGTVLLANLTRPMRVLLEGELIPERDDIVRGTEPGWRYADDQACLMLRVTKDGETKIRLEGTGLRYIERLPQPVDSLDFTFDSGREGWVAAHHIADLGPRSGVLAGTATGNDPYLIRSMTRVSGGEYPVLEIRMRVTARHRALTGGATGQFYWSTMAKPSIDEEKVRVFAIIPDGAFHVYRLDLRDHPLWAGQTITSIRIDPCNGAPSAEFAIDYVRCALSEGEAG